jgi:hypothetical protein
MQNESIENDNASSVETNSDDGSWSPRELADIICTTFQCGEEDREFLQDLFERYERGLATRSEQLLVHTLLALVAPPETAGWRYRGANFEIETSGHGAAVVRTMGLL